MSTRLIKTVINYKLSHQTAESQTDIYLSESETKELLVSVLPILGLNVTDLDEETAVWLGLIPPYIPTDTPIKRVQTDLEIQGVLHVMGANNNIVRWKETVNESGTALSNMINGIRIIAHISPTGVIRITSRVPGGAVRDITVDHLTAGDF